MKECDKPAFHEARKALKAWLGAQFLLGEPPDPGLVLLAELLGDENDLSVLEDWLESRGFCKNMAPVVWRIVSDRHHKLRVRVIEERDSAKIC